VPVINPAFIDGTKTISLSINHIYRTWSQIVSSLPKTYPSHTFKISKPKASELVRMTYLQ